MCVLMDNMLSQRICVRGRQSTHQILQAWSIIFATSFLWNEVCNCVEAQKHSCFQFIPRGREYFFTTGFGKWKCHEVLSWQVGVVGSLSAAKSLPEHWARLFAPCYVLFPAMLHWCFVAGTTHFSSKLWRPREAVHHLLAAISPLHGNILKKKSKLCYLGSRLNISSWNYQILGTISCKEPVKLQLIGTV